MKRIIYSAACVSSMLAIALTLTFHARAQGSKPFSNQSLNDKHGFHRIFPFNGIFPDL
jgi:hypothetical protein